MSTQHPSVPNLSQVSEAAPNIIECQADPGFQAWLAQAGGSLAITTYQALSACY